MKIKKAIIPAAGLGTRFLPATKAQPKEMLPIVDKPTIQYIIEEAVSSGIEDIIIVTGRGKRAIEDHFDKSFELEEVLKRQYKLDSLNTITSISDLADIHYIRQKEPRGLGHAIFCARKFIGNEPFAVLLGDDIVVSEVPALKQLIDVYEKYHVPIVGVQQVNDRDIQKYGIVSPGEIYENSGVFTVNSLVEKPRNKLSDINYAIMGRYILTPDIFELLDQVEPGTGGEIQLTDAISKLNSVNNVIGVNFEGKRYDVGDKFGFIKATIDFALQREDLRDELLNYIQNIGR